MSNGEPTGTRFDICTTKFTTTFIHNSQKVETTQMSIDEGMIKQTMVQPYGENITQPLERMTY